jgi:hypothetical protein
MWASGCLNAGAAAGDEDEEEEYIYNPLKLPPTPSLTPSDI